MQHLAVTQNVNNNIAQRLSTLGVYSEGIKVHPLGGLSRQTPWRLRLPHAEKTPLLLWITKGYSEVSAAARTRRLGPHTAVFLPAGMPWALDPGPGLQAVMVTLPVMPCYPETARILRIREIERQTELSTIVDLIAKAPDTDGGEQIKLAQALMLSAFIDQHPRTPSKTIDHRARELAQCFAYEVEGCYMNGLSLAQIGERIGVTATHLTRTCKATCGQTAAQYLNDRIMHEARCRLSDTGQSAAEISRSLGFSSPAYFSRAFIAHAGLPPGAFRVERPTSYPVSA